MSNKIWIYIGGQVLEGTVVNACPEFTGGDGGADDPAQIEEDVLVEDLHEVASDGE